MQIRTSSRWTGGLLILVGLCVLVWGVNARLGQYRPSAKSLAASFMLIDQDERGGMVVSEGERFRAPLADVAGCGWERLLEDGAAKTAVPARIRTSEAARLPIPPILFELLMRPPPPAFT